MIDLLRYSLSIAKIGMYVHTDHRYLNLAVISMIHICLGSQRMFDFDTFPQHHLQYSN